MRPCDKAKSSVPTVPRDVIDCRASNLPAYVFRTFKDQSGIEHRKNVAGARVITCLSTGDCTYNREFIGNAPARMYAVTTGWHQVPTTSGATAAYKEDTGPGYGYSAYDDNAEASNVSASNLADISCMPGGFGTEYGCVINDEVIADNDLPRYLPLVEENKVTGAGGSCESAPLCYSKDNHLIGLKKSLSSK